MRTELWIALGACALSAGGWPACSQGDAPAGGGGAAPTATGGAGGAAAGGGGGGGGCDPGAGGCAELVADGSFEGGPGTESWQEASTSFGTPLCSAATCGGVAAGSPPPHCAWWAWFGGESSGHEEASLAQELTIAAGASELTFLLEMSVCDGPQDYLEVRLDDDQVFHCDGTDPSCGQRGYELQTVDIRAFADGGVHTLRFHAETFAQNGSGSSFFVDRVSIRACGGAGVGGQGGAAGAGGVAGGGGAGG